LEQKNWDLIDLCATLNHVRLTWARIRPKGFFTGLPPSGNTPKDLAWFGPGGHEIEDWGAPGLSTVGMFMSPVSGDSLFVIYHAGEQGLTFTLPADTYAGRYIPILDTTFTNGKPPAKTYVSGDAVPITARSVLILQVTSDLT